MLIDDGKREQTRADGMVPLENGLLSIFSIWGRGRGGEIQIEIIVCKNWENIKHKFRIKHQLLLSPRFWLKFIRIYAILGR